MSTKMKGDWYFRGWLSWLGDFLVWAGLLEVHVNVTFQINQPAENIILEEIKLVDIPHA